MTRIGTWGLKESKRHSFLEEEQEGGPTELQDSQSHFSTSEGDGETLLEIISKHIKNRKRVGSS